MKRPTPIDAAREFRVNEMFFSTTDPAGRILSGNDVFVRVSGYAREQMLGQPHNLIRHPDMPRAVFRLIWDRLAAHQPVVGYVKNLACDGRHYWVLALLLPIKDGFLSIRFKPTTAWWDAIRAIYARMLAAEQEAEARGADRKAAMDAGAKALAGALSERGFADYDDAMRRVLHEEMKGRDSVLVSEGLRLFPEKLAVAIDHTETGRTLRWIYERSTRVYEQLNTLYAQLDAFVALHHKIEKKSALVLEQTAEFRFVAFNAGLRSSRMGEEARSLGVIADYLGATSARTGDVVHTVVDGIAKVSAKMRAVVFNLAAARLEIEMLLSFTAELAPALEGVAASVKEADVRRRMIEDLQSAFRETVQRAIDAFADLQVEIQHLETHSEDLNRLVLSLQVAQVGGLVEASRMVDDDSFQVMFTDLRAKVEATKAELTELSDITEQLDLLASSAPAVAAEISSAIAAMGERIQALGRAGVADAAAEAATKQAGRTRLPAIDRPVDAPVSDPVLLAAN